MAFVLPSFACRSAAAIAVSVHPPCVYVFQPHDLDEGDFADME